MELKHGKIEVIYSELTPAHVEILREEVEELVRHFVLYPHSALSIAQYEEVNR